MFLSDVQFQQYLTHLVTHDPCMRSALSIMRHFMFNSPPTVRVRGAPLSQSFEPFFTRYFMSVAHQVHLYQLFCGFIPWTISTLPNGDRVPVVLPIGSFSWEVKPVSTNERTASKRSKTGVTGNVYTKPPFFLKYCVRCVSAVGIDAADIIVSELLPPHVIPDQRNEKYDPQCVSNLYRHASPLAAVVFAYARLERATSRRSHADEWNTTARIVTTNTPPRLNTDAPNMELLDGLAGDGVANMASMVGSYTYENMQLRFSSHDTCVEDILKKDAGNHCPAVYTLPQHYRLERVDRLVPVEDISMLARDYHISISQMTGVSVALLTGESSQASSGLSKTVSMNAMTCDAMLQLVAGELCNIIEELLSDMYEKVYKHAGGAKQSHDNVIKLRWNFTHLAVQEDETETKKSET